MKQLIVLSLLVLLVQPLWAADKIRIYIIDVPIQSIQTTASVTGIELLNTVKGTAEGLGYKGFLEFKCEIQNAMHRKLRNANNPT